MISQEDIGHYLTTIVRNITVSAYLVIILNKNSQYYYLK